MLSTWRPHLMSKGYCNQNAVCYVIVYHINKYWDTTGGHEMVRMIKRVGVILLLVAVLSVGVGVNLCAQAKKPVVVVVAAALQHDFVRMLMKGTVDTLESLGYEAVTCNADRDYTKYVNDVEAAILRKVDGIICHHADRAKLAPLAKKAYDAGIPMITCDVTEIVPYTISDVTSDGALLGVTAARQILQDIEYKGRILAFRDPASQRQRTRFRMLCAMAEDYPEVKIEDIAGTLGAITENMAAMEALLLKYPKPGDIAAVWGGCDKVTIGVVQALERAGRKEVKAYGIDGDIMALQSIRKGGTYTATVAQSPYEMGRRAVMMLSENMGGKKKEYPPQIFCPLLVVTKDNVVGIAKELYGDNCWKEWGWK